MAVRRRNARINTKNGGYGPAVEAGALVLAAMVLAIIALAIASFAVYATLTSPAQQLGTLTSNQIRTLVNISKGYTPATLTTNTSTGSSSGFGHTTNGINEPLNSSELAVINNAPDSYFQTAGLMYLNGSIKNEVLPNHQAVNAFVVNNKTSVVYLGSITCIFCGENRWAMALALSRFGSFSQLYQGYSAFSDYDVPTLYWSTANYTQPDVLAVAQHAISIGSDYSSRYINFLPIEGQGNITGGFFLQSLPVIGAEVNSTGNATYKSAFSYLLSLQGSNNTAFKGTPYTIWGTSLFGGADAVDFGNTTPQTQSLPLTYMTHGQVLSQFANPQDQFAWTEYAAADIYVAGVCRSINNTAPVCSLSAIQRIEALK